jgi:hypothetical protein
MHYLLKHKMLQLTLKITLYMAPTCFGPFGPSACDRFRAGAYSPDRFRAGAYAPARKLSHAAQDPVHTTD